MTNLPERLIITAASQSFGPSLLALLGSLTVNWQNHPPVLVYDLGLDERTLAVLEQHQIAVKRVPPFCSHWRKYYAWKVWCWKDAPARNFLWIDAGIVVLQPLDEIFDTINQFGYFICGTGLRMTDNVSAAMCGACGLEFSFCKDKETLAGGILGINKEMVRDLLEEAISVAVNQEAMRATTPLHRWDQSLISLLLYKYFGEPHTANAQIYLEHKSPRAQPGQKVWVHRRAIDARDIRYFAKHLATAGAPYLPRTPHNWRANLPLYKLRRWLGRQNERLLFDGVRD